MCVFIYNIDDFSCSVSHWCQKERKILTPKWMNEWMHEWKNKWMNDEQMNEWTMNELMNPQTNEWPNAIRKKKRKPNNKENNMSPIKRICVFEHSVMTNFNCACPAIQRGQGSGFLSEGSSWFTVCMSEQRRFWRDCADVQARLNLRCSHRR